MQQNIISLLAALLPNLSKKSQPDVLKAIEEAYNMGVRDGQSQDR